MATYIFLYVCISLRHPLLCSQCFMRLTDRLVDWAFESPGLGGYSASTYSLHCSCFFGLTSFMVRIR